MITITKQQHQQEQPAVPIIQSHHHHHTKEKVTQFQDSPHPNSSSSSSKQQVHPPSSERSIFSTNTFSPSKSNFQFRRRYLQAWLISLKHRKHPYRPDPSSIICDHHRSPIKQAKPAFKLNKNNTRTFPSPNQLCSKMNTYTFSTMMDETPFHLADLESLLVSEEHLEHPRSSKNDLQSTWTIAEEGSPSVKPSSKSALRRPASFNAAARMSRKASVRHAPDDQEGSLPVNRGLQVKRSKSPGSLRPRRNGLMRATKSVRNLWKSTTNRGGREGFGLSTRFNKSETKTASTKKSASSTVTATPTRTPSISLLSSRSSVVLVEEATPSKPSLVGPVQAEVVTRASASTRLFLSPKPSKAKLIRSMSRRAASPPPPRPPAPLRYDTEKDRYDMAGSGAMTTPRTSLSSSSFGSPAANGSWVLPSPPFVEVKVVSPKKTPPMMPCVVVRQPSLALDSITKMQLDLQEQNDPTVIRPQQERSNDDRPVIVHTATPSASSSVSSCSTSSDASRGSQLLHDLDGIMLELVATKSKELPLHNEPFTSLQNRHHSLKTTYSTETPKRTNRNVGLAKQSSLGMNIHLGQELQLRRDRAPLLPTRSKGGNFSYGNH